LEKYLSPVHPVRTYVAGDLQIAYMKKNGRITARALVYPEKKIHTRIYGDSGVFRPLLEKEGFRSGVPTGAKLQRVIAWEDKTRKAGRKALVVPYIDDVSWVHDRGTHLEIGSGGSKPEKGGVAIAGPNGITEWISQACAHCRVEGPVSNFKTVYVTSSKNEQWCADCVKKDTFMCRTSGQTVMDSTDNAVTMVDGSKMWKRYFNDGHGFTCALDGNNYYAADRIRLKDGRIVSRKTAGVYLCKHCKVYLPSAAACDQTCKDARQAKDKADRERALQVNNALTSAAVGIASYTTYYEAQQQAQANLPLADYGATPWRQR